MRGRGILSMAVGMALSSSAHAECGNLATAVSSISEALAEVELEQASTLSQEAKKALECQESVVGSMVLTNLMQLSGAVHLFNGEQDLAKESFAWAIVVSPTSTIDPMYGDEAAATYKEVREQVLNAQPGSMTVLGEVEAWVDGRPITVGTPIDMAVGSHLMQWQEPDQAIQNRIITVDPQDERIIRVGKQSEVAQPVAAVVAAPIEYPDPFQFTTLSMVGGITAGVGVVSIILAGQSQKAFYAETDPTTLQGLKNRTNILSAAGVGLTTAGLGLVGVDVFLGGSGIAITVRR